MAPAKDSGTDSSSNFEVMALTVSAHARLSADFKEKHSFSNEWENIHVQT